MYKEIMKVIEEALSSQRLTIAIYKDENERLKKENEELKQDMKELESQLATAEEQARRTMQGA